jgi:hypothetical protein
VKDERGFVDPGTAGLAVESVLEDMMVVRSWKYVEMQLKKRNSLNLRIIKEDGNTFLRINPKIAKGAIRNS